MKKLANFKGSSSTDGNHSSSSKRNVYQMKAHSKKHGPSKNNNPYLASGHVNGSSSAPVNGHLSSSTIPTGRTASTTSVNQRRLSCRSSVDGLPPPTIGNRSVA